MIGHRWSSRPHRAKAHQAHAVLELLAWHARLQSGSVEVYWWRRSDLLFRRQLKLAAGPHASWPGLVSATYVALQHRSLKITARPPTLLARRRGDRVSNAASGLSAPASCASAWEPECRQFSDSLNRDGCGWGSKAFCSHRR